MTSNPIEKRNLPSISVVMPNYNHAHSMFTAVTAFARQTLPPDEILIVDDQSTDQSLDVAGELVRAYEIVRVICRQSRGGPIEAINHGLTEAKGDYVILAAADDTVEPHFVEHSLVWLAANPSAALSFLDPSAVFANGVKQQISLSLSDLPAHFSPGGFEALFAGNSFTISSNTVVYRRNALEAIGRYRPELEWNADWIANFILAFRHGACYRPEALANFIVNPQSYGERGRHSAKDQRRLLLKTLAVIATDYPDVAPRFKRAALVPDMRLRALVWILMERQAHWILSPNLIVRLVSREVWTHIRPFASESFRKAIRRLAARSTTL